MRNHFFTYYSHPLFIFFLAVLSLQNWLLSPIPAATSHRPTHPEGRENVSAGHCPEVTRCHAFPEEKCRNRHSRGNAGVTNWPSAIPWYATVSFGRESNNFDGNCLFGSVTGWPRRNPLRNVPPDRRVWDNGFWRRASEVLCRRGTRSRAPCSYSWT